MTPAAWGLPNTSERGIKSEVAPGGYITPAVRGLRNASEVGTKSEVPHKWARITLAENVHT
jgi:hypothetical protein